MRILLYLYEFHVQINSRFFCRDQCLRVTVISRLTWSGNGSTSFDEIRVERKIYHEEIVYRRSRACLATGKNV